MSDTERGKCDICAYECDGSALHLPVNPSDLFAYMCAQSDISATSFRDDLRNTLAENGWGW